MSTPNPELSTPPFLHSTSHPDSIKKPGFDRIPRDQWLNPQRKECIQMGTSSNHMRHQPSTRKLPTHHQPSSFTLTEAKRPYSLSQSHWAFQTQYMPGARVIASIHPPLHLHPLLPPPPHLETSLFCRAQRRANLSTDSALAICASPHTMQ